MPTDRLEHRAAAAATSLRTRLGIAPWAPARVSLHLSRAATRAVSRGERLVFQEAVLRTRGEGAAGDLAILYGPNDKPFAVGLYDPDAALRVRVLTTTLGQPIDVSWLRARIHEAVESRRFDLSTTDGFRLLHGIGEGLPGLVIDRYAGTCVIKVYSAAWLPWLPEVVGALAAMVPGLEAVLLRLNRQLQGLGAAIAPWHEGQRLFGEEAALATRFVENGLVFEVEPREGQKTGFFLDQRENRARVGEMAAGKRVLNVFCYTGGFSLYAARGGATEVVSIDASKLAMEALARNFALNEAVLPSKLKTEHLTGDAFALMSELRDAGRGFGVVIVDPPSFAKRSAEVEAARSAYRRLAQLGASLVVPGGTLVFASCSSRVTTAMLEEELLHGAAQARKRLTIIAREGHPADHPIALESQQYLGCIYARVDG